ncbi:MAG: Ig-like domain-containing protein [Minicystis sp.]
MESSLGDPPAVILTAPRDGKGGQAVDSVVRAVFSESMAKATINTTTFTLVQDRVIIPATVTYEGSTATLTPRSPLAAGTSFVATISTGATNIDGTALNEDHVWSFTTRDPHDTTAPRVSFTDPPDGALGVALDSQINAAFSEVMSAASLNEATFTVRQGEMLIPGVVSYSSQSVVFIPSSPLSARSAVTATITTRAHDFAGNALAVEHVWSFTTTALPDTASPAVTFTDPTNEATGFDAKLSINAAFNETMDCATLNAATFTLAQGATSIPGVVTCSGPTATFTPNDALTPGALITATLTTGVNDLVGNAFPSEFVWSFTVSATPEVVSPAVMFANPHGKAAGVARETH